MADVKARYRLSMPSRTCETARSPAKADRPAFDLDAFLPYQLAVAAAAVSHGLAAVYAERFDLSIPEWRILANLGRHGTLTAGEVATKSSLDKVQVARALKNLARRRLVQRRTDKEDRRRAHLSLSPDGERLRADIAALALRWEQRLLADLSPVQRKALMDSLLTLAARAADVPAGRRSV